jgi:CheY-like chemotaxis protein
MKFEDCTILVVDDNEAYLTLFADYFTRLHFKAVLTARNGNAAVSILTAQPVDLILSDWDMPGIDGLMLLEWVRSNENIAHLPFVMMTARIDEVDRLKVIYAGVTDFIVKPFSPNDLLDKLRSALLLEADLDFVLK